VGDGDAGQNAVRLPRQVAQDGRRIGRVDRLADDVAGHFQRRVGGQHRTQQQAPLEEKVDAVLGLGPGDALDIGSRRFAGMQAFVNLRVGAQSAAEDDGVERHPHLGQEFAAARAARGKVDTHDGC